MGQDHHVKVVEASVRDIPLEADLIVMAEMLTYVPEPVMDVLSRLRGRYLLTSYRGTFDTCLRQGLQACGWRESLSAQVFPRFEPVDGRDSLLIARRPGTQNPPLAPRLTVRRRSAVGTACLSSRRNAAPAASSEPVVGLRHQRRFSRHGSTQYWRRGVR